MIGDEEAKIYAISDKFSRNLSNDYIDIPEGNEDISLDGNTSFNLARLNGFTFNAESNEEKLAHRQKMNKRGIITIIVAAIIGFLIGFSVTFAAVRISDFNKRMEAAKEQNQPQTYAEKVFEKDGIILTLDESFAETNEYTPYQYVAMYKNEYIYVFVACEKITEPDLLQYTKNLLNDAKRFDKGKFDKPTLIEGGYYYSKYYTEKEDSKGQAVPVTDYVFTFENGSKYWTIEFITPSVNTAFSKQITDWADLIKFNEVIVNIEDMTLNLPIGFKATETENYDIAYEYEGIKFEIKATTITEIEADTPRKYLNRYKQAHPESKIVDKDDMYYLEYKVFDSYHEYGAMLYRKHIILCEKYGDRLYIIEFSNSESSFKEDIKLYKEWFNSKSFKSE